MKGILGTMVGVAAFDKVICASCGISLLQMQDKAVYNRPTVGLNLS